MSLVLLLQVYTCQSFNLWFVVVFASAVCGLLITLDFREPAGHRSSRCSSPARTQVSRHASAAVIMLVNGLTRLGTTNDGSSEHVLDGAATLFCPVAIYSGLFRRHEMTILEIIIAILHCQTDGVFACMRSCMISSHIWALWYRKLDESAIDITISRNWYDP